MVRIRNLHFGYTRRAMQLENLNLDLLPGRIYGLLGKNGAGKSTLLKNIVGLAFPQVGSCEVGEQPASRRQPSTLSDLYFLPEDAHAPSLTGAQLASSLGSFYPHFDARAFHDYLGELEVASHVRLTTLSFGQQKKALIAFALATNTGLLVLDEPTNGLDIPSKAQFRKLVARSLGEERCVIISTHQVRDLDSLIDTVLVLHERRIVLDAGLDALAEQLRFGTLPAGAPTGPEVLYAEASVRGQQVIETNTGGAYSKVDLELLFNALTGPAAAALSTHLQQLRHAQSVF